MSSIVKPRGAAVADPLASAVKTSTAYNVFEPGMAAYYHGMYLLRAICVLAVIAVSLGACGGDASNRRVRRPGDDWLKAIKFEGVSLSHENLLAGLALKRNLDAGRSIDEYQLGLDTQRIIGLYQRRGFFSVTVTPRVEKQGDASILIFKVVEGPRAVTSVVLTGLPTEIPYAEARALIEVENGDPFDYDLFDAAKSPLLALVENAGYAHARLDAQVLADRAKARATLRYTIDPGAQVRFGAITLSGVDGDLAEAAKNRLPFAEGDLYSTKRVAQAQQAIYGIGRFAAVRIDVDRLNESTTIPVKIALTEAKRWEARAGVGLGFDTLTYNGRLRGSLTHDGWPTPLTRLGVELRPALTVKRDDCEFWEVWTCEDPEPRIRLLGSITQQDFLYRDVRADLEGGLDYLRLEAYTVTGARMRTGLERALYQRRILMRVGWQLGYYTFDDLSLALTMTEGDMEVPTQKAIDLGVTKRERLGAFSETISIDYRDNPITPRLGAYGELRFTHGGAYAGGAYDYLQIMPDVRGYLPLGTFVLAGHARFGVIRGDVAPTERFYAGGAASHRGFPERHLSPSVSRDIPASDPMDPPTNVTVPIGGAAMVETGVELRVPFTLFGIPMGAAAFLDGGDVTEAPGDIDASNLHWATGLSFRPYYLPIGPIRLDIAYRLNRTGGANPVPDSRWNFVFSLGEAF
jgi:translocation and assembly module TamA